MYVNLLAVANILLDIRLIKRKIRVGFNAAEV